MIVLAITGSIGMGKTTITNMFRDQGIPIHSADDAVHQIYEEGISQIPLLSKIAPTAINPDGSVDRHQLRHLADISTNFLHQVERIVHPLVQDSQNVFLEHAESNNATVAILDIPLLFETGQDKEVNLVLVATASHAIQRQRVLARPEMTEERFQRILAKQLPDAEKRERADYVINTEQNLEVTRAEIQRILVELTQKGDS